MNDEYATQYGNAPTRKATVAATIASIISPMMLIISFHFGPEVMPPYIAEAWAAVIYGVFSLAVSLIVTVVPYVGIAWWTADRPNKPPREEFEG